MKTLQPHQFLASLRNGFVILSIIIAALRVQCGPPAWVTSGKSLYYVPDISAPTSIEIGQIEGRNALMSGIAISPSGQLYGADYDGYLYSIDKTTGLGTTIGNIGIGYSHGLAFLGDTLYSISTQTQVGIRQISSIDIHTAAITPVFQTTSSVEFPRALAFVDSTLAFVLAYNRLASVNLLNGTVTDIGPLSGHGPFKALGLASDGTLYASDLYGDIYTVNKSTAVATPIGHIFSTPEDGGMVIDNSAVPEVSTSPAILMGFVIIVLFRKASALHEQKGHLLHPHSECSAPGTGTTGC